MCFSNLQNIFNLCLKKQGKKPHLCIFAYKFNSVQTNRDYSIKTDFWGSTNDTRGLPTTKELKHKDEIIMAKDIKLTQKSERLNQALLKPHHNNKQPSQDWLYNQALSKTLQIWPLIDLSQQTALQLLLVKHGIRTAILTGNIMISPRQH